MKAVAGETGIFCVLSTDAAHSWTGSCYTLTVTVDSPDDMSTGPVAAQGKQLYSYVSSGSSIFGTDLVVRLGSGDWDFWNTTMYSGYYTVPWIDYGNSNGISDLLDSIFYQSITIHNNCF